MERELLTLADPRNNLVWCMISVALFGLLAAFSAIQLSLSAPNTKDSYKSKKIERENEVPTKEGSEDTSYSQKQAQSQSKQKSKNKKRD